MKTIGLRTLYKEAPVLTEEVLVLQGRRVLGSFKPFNKETALEFDMADLWPHLQEVEDMPEADNIAKKAIAPDAVKREPRGRLSKGLGDLPGDSKTDERDPYREFRPVPKK
jgi:hypothetical protein